MKYLSLQDWIKNKILHPPHVPIRIIVPSKNKFRVRITEQRKIWYHIKIISLLT